MTYIIIAITVIVSIWALSDAQLMEKLLFSPYKTIHGKEWHRLLSHAFVHADYVHLFVNMIVLLSFGMAAERIFESLKYNGIISSAPLHFLVLYFGGVVVASLTTLKKYKDNYYYRSVGASGAVSAVVFWCIFFNPLERLYLMAVIPIPGIVFGIAYLAYSHYMSKKDFDNINHDAHFVGAVFGFIYPILINPRLIFVFLGKLGLF